MDYNDWLNQEIAQIEAQMRGTTKNSPEWINAMTRLETLDQCRRVYQQKGSEPLKSHPLKNHPFFRDSGPKGPSLRWEFGVVVLVMVLFAALMLLMSQGAESAIKPEREAVKNLESAEQSSQDKEAGTQAKSPGEVDAFVSSVQNRVKSFWKPPRRQKDMHGVVEFEIARDGSLNSEPRMIESFHDIKMDEAAINAVKQAAPFSPWPDTLEEPEVTFQMTLDYRVKKEAYMPEWLRYQ